MRRPRACPRETVWGQQLPLPLDLRARPSPVLPPHQLWAALPPQVQAQVRAVFILVAREVLDATDRR